MVFYKIHCKGTAFFLYMQEKNADCGGAGVKNSNKFAFFLQNSCVFQIFVVLLQPQKKTEYLLWTIITRRMQQVRAKKFLGQHFLTDLTVAQKIADTITSGRTIEIGPGMGVLTQYLLKNPNINLTAIEIDRESVAYLREWYPELDLVEGDFLKLDLNQLIPEGEFNVIGNYPYNISSQIFFKVLEYKDRIPVCSGMIQKEVAERLASKPGKKAYGILSVLLQAYYDIEYLFTVDEHVFNPPPKVKSAVIRMTRNKRRRLDCDEALFKTIVKTSFNQRKCEIR